MSPKSDRCRENCGVGNRVRFQRSSCLHVGWTCSGLIIVILLIGAFSEVYSCCPYNGSWQLQTHGTSVLAFEADLWRQLGASPQNVTGRRLGILSWAETGLGVWVRERQREARSSVCHSLSHRDSGQLLATEPSRIDKREARPGSVLEQA